MTRDEMIDILIEDDILMIVQCVKENDFSYLDFILRDGINFNSMTNDALMNEYFSRSWEMTEQ
jgi:hypothetical protein